MTRIIAAGESGVQTGTRVMLIYIKVSPAVACAARGVGGHSGPSPFVWQ